MLHVQYAYNVRPNAQQYIKYLYKSIVENYTSNRWCKNDDLNVVL